MRYDARVPRIDTLHVAALPYPTSQGTQAAIGCMVDALASQGRSTALLTYASGAGTEMRFEHRVTHGRVQPRSLRSGPSLEKIAADVALGAALRTQAREADVVVAHHVEAAALAMALRLPRWIFVAHTTLGPELPTYLPPRFAGLAARSGRALDRVLMRGAPGVAAISVHVADEIHSLASRDAVVLPVPIAAPEPAPSRDEARRALGVEGPVILYAGNLDAYQGLDALVDAAARLHDVTVLVATESDPAPLRARFAAHGVAPRFAPLATEDDRARAHAAADVAVVTRGTPGGFPIKLLDAMSRGVPVVAMRRALSGHDVPGIAIARDDAVSLAAALKAMLDAPPDVRSRRAREALDHVRRHHDAASFVRALDEAIARLQVRA